MPSALTKSVLDLEVPVSFSNGADGRFAVMVQPILGKDGVDPTTFKVAMAVPGFAVQTTLWSAPGSYLEEVGGVNVRQDPYVPQLTGTSPFFYGLSNGTGTAANTPFGTAPLFDPLNYGSQLDYEDNGGGVDPTFRGGPGVYNVTLYMSSAAPNLVVSTDTVGATVTLAPTGEVDSAGSPTGTAYILNANGTWQLNVTATANPVTSWITITPAAYSTVSGWQNAGAVAEIRPVNMEALFTCDLAALQNGGNIASALVPPSTCASNWFNLAAQNSVGQLQAWEALSRVPGAYSGALKDGAYARYRPVHNLDYSYRSPEAMNTYSYPCLMICGQMSNPGGAGSVNIGRLRISTGYEFLTNTNLWSLETSPGSTNAIEQALSLVSGEPTSSANGEHLETIRRFMSAIGRAATGVGKFVYNNRDVIVPIAQRLAGLVL